MSDRKGVTSIVRTTEDRMLLDVPKPEAKKEYLKKRVCLVRARRLVGLDVRWCVELRH